MTAHTKHPTAKFCTLFICAAAIVCVSCLAAILFKQIFGFDIFTNYVAAMMLVLTVTVLVVPFFGSCYQKWIYHHDQHTRC